jgi:hypothetical protein
MHSGGWNGDSAAVCKKVRKIEPSRALLARAVRRVPGQRPAERDGRTGRRVGRPAGRGRADRAHGAWTPQRPRGVRRRCRSGGALDRCRRPSDAESGGGADSSSRACRLASYAVGDGDRRTHSAASCAPCGARRADSRNAGRRRTADAGIRPAARRVRRLAARRCDRKAPAVRASRSTAEKRTLTGGCGQRLIHANRSKELR